MAFSRPGLTPAVEDRGELLLAAYHRQQLPGLMGLKAALDRALLANTVSGDRPLQALEGLRPKIVEIKGGPEQAAGRLAHDHRSWRGNPLQPRRQVGGLADHDTLARLVPADQVAHHDQAGRNPNPHTQRCASWGGHARDRLCDGQPGPHGTLRLILVSLGPAEVGQHPIPHEFGDVTFEAGDLAGHGILKGADDLMHLFGIEARGKRRRADEIAEHHGQLPALGFGGSTCPLGRLIRRVGLPVVVQRGERLEQLLAVTEKHPQLLEVGLAEFRQNLRIDGVGAEHRLVLFETEGLKPCADVHRCSLFARQLYRKRLWMATIAARMQGCCVIRTGR